MSPNSPPTRRRSSREMSAMIALCGLMTALSVVLMLAGGVMFIATYAAPLLASALLLPPMLEYGRRAGWTCWLAAGLLALILGLDKEAAFFYLFIGWWPLVKWQLEKRVPQKTPRLLLKLAIFLAAILAMYAFIGYVLHLDAITAEFGEMGRVMTALFFAAMALCLLLYDRLLMPLVALYAQKLRPKLKFLRN